VREINAHLEKHNILTPVQHGFRKHMSCETQLAYIANELSLNIEHGNITDLVILDFSKAFDSVNHRKLLQKLSMYGINCLIYLWTEQFLSFRKQFVIVGNPLFNEVKVISGVPQGSVLGPLLFLIYTNDLPLGVDSQIQLFADDALLFNVRKNKNQLQ